MIKAEFSASLLQSSVHDPSEIILIYRCIINVGNSCAAHIYLFIGTCDKYFLGGSLINKKLKRTEFIQQQSNNISLYHHCFYKFNKSLLNKKLFISKYKY